MDELCKQLEWNLLNAASSFSSFSGLAASLVLASMVIIMIEHRGDESLTIAVAVFTVALLALGLDTFVFGAASGEVLCARGDTQGLLGGSTLATGVVVLLLGITLLQAKFKHAHAGLTLLGNVLTSMAAAGTLTLMALWSVRFVNNLKTLRLLSIGVVSYAPSLIVVGLFAVVALIIALVAPGDRGRQITIIVTMCIYVVHVFVSFVMYVATIVIPVSQWTVHTGSAVLIPTIAIAIVFPFVELAGVVMSLDWRGGREFWH